MSPKNCVTIFEGLLGHGFSVLIRNLFNYMRKVLVLSSMRRPREVTMHACSKLKLFIQRHADRSLASDIGSEAVAKSQLSYNRPLVDPMHARFLSMRHIGPEGGGAL